ncbi:MAG: CIA30 family protein [Pseudomonadota bacterium]
MLELNWIFGADTVMGGVSEGYVQRDGNAARLTGTVSLDNNGGFIQMAADVAGLDGSGLRFQTRGDGAAYVLSLRTTALTRPWQSFRLHFVAPQAWTDVTLRFADVQAHRTDAVFHATQVRRLGVLAVGTARNVDVAVREMRTW